MGDGQVASARARAWWIAGAGYTGMRLATRLAEAGARVIATRRNVAALTGLDDTIECRAVDLGDPETLAGAIPAGAVVVDLAPPAPTGTAAEHNLAAAAAAAGAARVVYVSSTGVYGAADGRWVDEDEPTVPLGPRGGSRLEAERALLAAARERDLEAVSLRVAGIYGPGRGVVARMRAGSYRIIGAGDTFVSRVHVYDLCSAIIAAGVVSPLPRSVYNVADDEPTTSTEYAAAVAEALDLDLPPRVPESEVSTSVAAMLGANRRVSNARLKAELGVELRYPGWRDSLADENS